jgi:Flp pilus assembly protein TadD
MKMVLALALALAAAAAPAADMPPTPAPAAAKADRMANARRAIASEDWNVAVRELQVAVRDTPQNADAHNLLGYSYRKRANPDLAKAFEHYEMALKIDPRHKGAHEYIGQAYLLQKKPAEAEMHLTELEKICGGRGCEEYQDLAKAITEYKARN